MEKGKTILSEDWAVNVIGLGIIFLAVFGFSFSSPDIKWETWADLTQNILSVSNLSKFLLQFIFVYVAAIIGFALT